VSKELIKLSRAEQQLAVAKDIPALWEIHNIAAAAETYARAHRLETDAVSRAVRVRLLAARRIGELVPAVLNEGGPKRRSEVRTDIPKQRLSEFRQLAAIPVPRFEQKLALAEHDPKGIIWSTFLKLGRFFWKRKQAKEAQEEPDIPDGENWQMILGDMRQTKLSSDSIDAIVTDPPYPREFLPLYADLAKMAAEVLRPGGVLAVMVGQSHLPDVFRLIDGLDYHWTMAYLTPGTETRIWGRSMYTHWKPILLYSKGKATLDWAMDLVVSPAADKAFHDWGQSVKGMTGLIDALTDAGDIVLDPFAGPASTGLACLSTGRKFIGIEIDEGHYRTARKRLREAERGDDD